MVSIMRTGYKRFRELCREVAAEVGLEDGALNHDIYRAELASIMGGGDVRVIYKSKPRGVEELGNDSERVLELDVTLTNNRGRKNSGHYISPESAAFKDAGEYRLTFRYLMEGSGGLPPIKRAQVTTTNGRTVEDLSSDSSECAQLLFSAAGQERELRPVVKALMRMYVESAGPVLAEYREAAQKPAEPCG